MTGDSNVRVLYILGTGRCGSTVLSNLVGSSDRYVSVGEIYYIWDRGFQENRLCGCGRRFLDCEFWQAVVSAAEIDSLAAKHGLEIREASIRTRNALQPGSRQAIGEFQELVERLYRAVLELSGADVIVDSSKFPVYGDMLAKTKRIEVSGLLMVRDPRAVAYSRSRRKKLRPDHAEDVGPAYFQRHGVLRSATTWVAWNLLAELKWRDRKNRFAVLRYEDFVANPDGAFEFIGEIFGIAIDPPKLDKTTYAVSRSHALSGNPVRFDHGALALKPDDEWVDGMPTWRKVAISVLTFPVLPRYGYIASR